MSNVLEEYHRTLDALYSLLEKKRAQRRKVLRNMDALLQVNRHIAVIEDEIREVQDAIRVMERKGPADGVYGYRKRRTQCCDGDVVNIADFK